MCYDLFSSSFFETMKVRLVVSKRRITEKLSVRLNYVV
jgi:hypothetical protein